MKNLETKTIHAFEQNPEKEFTAPLIADFIMENFKQECREMQRTSTQFLETDDDVKKQITRELYRLNNNKPFHELIPSVVKLDQKPMAFMYVANANINDQPMAEIDDQPVSKIQEQPVAEIKEQNLYLPLINFLFTEFEIYGKRIDEKKSSNSNGAGANKWAHPDVVGLTDLTKNDCAAIKKLKKAAHEKRHETYSFEVKLDISATKVSEYIAQTRQNSRWADRRYLVVSHIPKGNTLTLLDDHCRRDGIGLIGLDANDESKTEIIIEAPVNQQAELDARDKLASENSDFADYITLISDFIATDRLKETDWDIDLD